MDLICPKCGGAIGGQCVNVVTDLAQCPSCNEVHKASELAAAASPQVGFDQPAGSKILFTGDAQSAVFEIPRAGFSPGMTFPLVFALFWVGSVAFWTWGASQGSKLFAMFSIPFWLVGLGMLGGILNAIFERQRIELTSTGLRVESQRPFLARSQVIPVDEIGSIEMGRVVPTNPLTLARHMSRFSQASGTAGIEMPVIYHGTRKTTFAEHVSEAEQRWLVKVLKTIVLRLAGRRV